MEKLNELNFVDIAEKVIQELQEFDKKGNPRFGITTSKIRGLLTMVNSIYNQVLKQQGDDLSEGIQSDIQYLKMKFAYEAGRDNSVRKFVQKAAIMKHIEDIKDSKAQALIFCKYMESLVAYHRYYGGQE